MNAKCWLLAVGLTACDVPVIRPNEVGLGYNWSSNGLCPRGLAVVDSIDQSQSANIALASLTGQMLSQSIMSSASSAPGLTAALGGDVAFPSMPMQGDEIVLIDRYPKGVLTWVNIATASVRAQLSVGTGFSSNPHDYVPQSPNKAFVTRANPNANAGREMFDGGSDILIIDPSIPTITSRIDLSSILPSIGNFVPHPDRAWLISDLLYVIIPLYDANFTAGESYVVVFDAKTDTFVQKYKLEGLAGCSGVSASPDQANLAVACSGRWQGSSTASNTRSGIVGLRRSPDLAEIWRIPATSVGKRAFGFDVAFVDATHVLATQLGELGPPSVNDSAFLMDITNGSATRLLESAPFSLGAGPCSIACGACFIADAGRSRLFNVQFSNSHGPSLIDYVWTDPTGLPPRSLAFF
jgi:hypothetical protein